LGICDVIAGSWRYGDFALHAREEGGYTFCIYKDFKNIPEEVWTKVGKEKPENL
jgi:hypothetical protein